MLDRSSSSSSATIAEMLRSMAPSSLSSASAAVALTRPELAAPYLARSSSSSTASWSMRARSGCKLASAAQCREASREARRQLRPVPRREEALEALRRGVGLAPSVDDGVASSFGARRGFPLGDRPGRALVLHGVEDVGDVRGEPREVLDRSQRRRGRRPLAGVVDDEERQEQARRSPGRRRAGRAWPESRLWCGRSSVGRRSEQVDVAFGRRPRRSRLR